MTGNLNECAGRTEPSAPRGRVHVRSVSVTLRRQSAQQERTIHAPTVGSQRRATGLTRELACLSLARPHWSVCDAFTRHRVLSKFLANSLKTIERRTRQVTHILRGAHDRN